MNNAHRRCINNGCQRIQKCDGPHDCELNAEISAPFDLARAQSPAEAHWEALVTKRSAAMALNHLANNSVYKPEALAYATSLLVEATQAKAQPKGSGVEFGSMRSASMDKAVDLCERHGHAGDAATLRELRAALATQAPAPGAVEMEDLWRADWESFSATRKEKFNTSGSQNDFLAGWKARDLRGNQAPAVAQQVPPGWVFERQAEPLEGHLRIQDPNGRYVYVGAECLDTTEKMLFDLATTISKPPVQGSGQ